MKKIISKIANLISELYGNVVVIGFDDEKIIKAIEKNNRIHNSDFLTSLDVKGKSGDDKSKLKVLKFNKLKKHYGKKKLDYLICKYEHINTSLKYFISSSIYITKQEILIVCEKENINKIKKLYSRYTSKITVDNYDNYAVITVNTNNVYPNYFKDKYYHISDLFTTFIDHITNFLIN